MPEQSSGTSSRPPASDAFRRTPILDQVLIESQAMLRHALASGMQVSPSAIRTVAQAVDGDDDAQPVSISALARAHAELAALVAPATPRMLVIFDSHGDEAPRWRRFTRIPLIPQMMTMAVVAMVSFIGLSLSGYINNPEYGSITHSSGLPLLINELFFLSAAAVGAAFSGLFEAMRFIQSARFDPRYRHIYWIKILLGLIAGLILATLFHIDQSEEIDQLLATSSAAPSDAATSALGVFQLTSAGLALLGGFSANLLYRVLTRLSDAVETMIAGEPSTRQEDRQTEIDEGVKQELKREQVAMAGQLMALARDADDQTRARLESMLGKLLGTELADEAEATPGATPGALPAAATAAAPAADDPAQAPRTAPERA